MIEYAGIAAMILGTAVAYGELRQRVNNLCSRVDKESEDRERCFSLLRQDIKRADEKIENLIDYLLRKNGDKR